MSDHEPTGLSRRQLLKTGALLAAAPILGATRPAAAQSPAKSTKVLDFQTGADVAKAEQEGEVVYYGHDGEAGIAALLDGFRKDFPKIKTSYVRPRPARSTPRSPPSARPDRFGVDVLQLSDISPAIDFQKKGGYEQLRLARSTRPTSPSTSQHARPATSRGPASLRRHRLQHDQGEARAGAEDLEGHR